MVARTECGADILYIPVGYDSLFEQADATVNSTKGEGAAEERSRGAAEETAMAQKVDESRSNTNQRAGSLRTPAIDEEARPRVVDRSHQT